MPDKQAPPRATAILVAAVALVNRSGHVLIQQRPAGREHGGLWEFPGGKLEPGEGPVAALIRELREELAILVRPEECQPLGFAASEAGTRAVLLLLYGCRSWHGDPRSTDGAALHWCTPVALTHHAMPPLDVVLIPLARRFARVRKPLAKLGPRT